MVACFLKCSVIFLIVRDFLVIFQTIRSLVVEMERLGLIGVLLRNRD
jgi:hypothetical protein